MLSFLSELLFTWNVEIRLHTLQIYKKLRNWYPFERSFSELIYQQSGVEKEIFVWEKRMYMKESIFPILNKTRHPKTKEQAKFTLQIKCGFYSSYSFNGGINVYDVCSRLCHFLNWKPCQCVAYDWDLTHSVYTGPVRNWNGTAHIGTPS